MGLLGFLLGAAAKAGAGRLLKGLGKKVLGSSSNVRKALATTAVGAAATKGVGALLERRRRKKAKKRIERVARTEEGRQRLKSILTRQREAGLLGSPSLPPTAAAGAGGAAAGASLRGGGIISKVKDFAEEHPVAAAGIGAAAAAAAAYGIEQLAERAGVRGGAGFVGARPRRRRRGRYAYLRVPRNRRGKGKLSRGEESSLRRLARRYSKSDGNSPRRRRRKSRSARRSGKWVSFTTKGGKRVKFRAR